MSSERAGRLAQHVVERELDMLLVSDLVNVRYLTGFTGTSGLALVGPGRNAFVTDARYGEQAEAQVDEHFERATATPDLLDGLPELVGTARPLRLGFDDAKLSVRRHAQLAELLEGVELVPAGGLVEELRAVKDADELAAMRAAAELADEAFRAVVELGLAGRSEQGVALALEDAMRHRGASAPAFPSIVAAGPHAALPHAEPRDEEIPAGVLVVVDWGCVLDGYCSDCTRTVATGAVGDEERGVHALVAQAQQAGLDAVRAGPRGRDVDAVARAVIEEAGHGEDFAHGLGHGLGLEVHEGPTLSRTRGEEQLRAGNVVTVEPGVYLPGRFGARIEDTVAVTDEGCEVISGIAKDLADVG